MELEEEEGMTLKEEEIDKKYMEWGEEISKLSLNKYF